jgi:transcriptional regulator with XRE-family HTH domain
MRHRFPLAGRRAGLSKGGQGTPTGTERGFTQEELAFKSGYHPTYIGQLERGTKSPSLRTIMSLAGALKTRGSELLIRVESVIDKAR